MRHDARTPGVAQVVHRPASSHSLTDARLYRPGALLAAGVLLVPPAVALLGAGITLERVGRIPLWLPLVLLLWLPLLAAAWLTMISVRTSPAGIATARPWGQWNELQWTLIERVRRSGPCIVVHSSDGRSARFFPVTLRDGARLKREILMRLPVHILDMRLRADARNLFGEPIGQHARSLSLEPLRARPRGLWSAAFLLPAGMSLAGASAALLLWPFSIALAAAAVTLLVLIGCSVGLSTCRQTITLTESGITVTDAFGRQRSQIAWEHIQLVERTPGDRALRLRGDHRVRCAGPGLFAASDAETFRAYLQTYCVDRGALVIVRRWL